MTQIFEGPIERWQMNSEDWQTMENWLVSDSEVLQARAGALLSGCYVQEFALPDTGSEPSTLVLGCDIEQMAESHYRQTGEAFEHWPTDIHYFIREGATIGEGATRAERIRNATLRILQQKILQATRALEAKPRLVDVSKVQTSPIISKLAELGVRYT